MIHGCDRRDLMAFVKHDVLHRWLVNFTSCESTADKIKQTGTQ